MSMSIVRAAAQAAGATISSTFRDVYRTKAGSTYRIKIICDRPNQLWAELRRTGIPLVDIRVYDTTPTPTAFGVTKPSKKAVSVRWIR